jgi:glycosyltransferase involved in cell wall biosynthesis
MTSDVTAVVLTTGEATTEDAIASLGRQSLPVAEIVTVRDVRPFHRALNQGAMAVSTPYFVQVDADMVLDAGCVAALRAGMGKTTGVTVGHLRDPLLGDIVGVKLYRTQCFSEVGFRDTISPDTQFAEDLAAAGWSTRFVGGHGSGPSRSYGTLGEHRPDYAPAYTYRKHLMEGQRYRHRNAIGGFRGHLRRLELSDHPVALIAQVALARGFFRRTDVDALGLEAGNDEYARLAEFLNAAPMANKGLPQPGRTPLRSAFVEWFALGDSAFASGDGAAFRSYMQALNDDPAAVPAWPLKLSLCQGLFPPAGEIGGAEQAFAFLEPYLAGRFKGLDDLNVLTDRMFDYARSAGLSRFTLAPPHEGEYRRTKGAGFERTGAVIAARFEANGRPRIGLPLRPFGHIVCPDPERLEGLAWCLDALKAGYTTAHVPTNSANPVRSLPLLVAQQLFDRLGGSRLLPKQRPFPDLTPLVAARPPAYTVAGRRILMATQDLGRGGSERQMVAVIEGLVNRGYDVRVISLNRLDDGKPSYEAEIELLGVPVEYAEDELGMPEPVELTSEGKAVLRHGLPVWLGDRMAPIQRAIIRHRPEVVHSWLDATGLAAGVAGCSLGVPRTIIHQGSMAIVRRGNPASEAMRRTYLALSANSSITIVNNSLAGARDNEAWIGLSAETIGLIYNGFLPGSARVPAAEEVAALRRSLGLTETTRVVGTAMRFVKEKDPELWIATAAAISRIAPDVRFVIFGFGSLEGVMRSQIEQHGLQNAIVMAGPTADVGLAYSAMDVVLMTSGIEGLPNVMIEAQAVGRPVVSTDVGGTREALIEGVTGTVVGKRSPKVLARAVVDILDDDTLRRRVQTAGPEFVAARFGLDRMIEDVLRYAGFDG